MHNAIIPLQTHQDKRNFQSGLVVANADTLPSISHMGTDFKNGFLHVYGKYGKYRIMSNSTVKNSSVISFKGEISYRCSIQENPYI